MINIYKSVLITNLLNPSNCTARIVNTGTEVTYCSAPRWTVWKSSVPLTLNRATTRPGSTAAYTYRHFSRPLPVPQSTTDIIIENMYIDVCKRMSTYVC